MVSIWSHIADLTTPYFDGSRDIAMVTNFRVEIGQIGLFTFIRSHGISRRIAISFFSDFKKLICDNLATSCVNLVNFDPVTPEFKGVVGVHTLIFKKSFETNHLRIYLTDFHQIFTIW